jgi:hypothetical protein
MPAEFPRMMKVNELKLGDVVELFEGPFGTAIVSEVAPDNGVRFYRPYGHHNDVAFGTRVSCYVGIEDFARPMSDTATIKVWRRADHLR